VTLPFYVEMNMQTRKTAIITGASQGIGAGLANGFLKGGYNVVATSRRVSQSTEINASDRLARVDGDIADPETAKAVVETALARFGAIDALVNNAGIFFTKPFIDYTIEDYRRLAATNLEGFLHLTQRVVRQMLAQNHRCRDADDAAAALLAHARRLQRAGNRRRRPVPDRGAAHNRGGAARRWRRTSGKMVTRMSAQVSAEQQLSELRIALPPPPTPFGAYVETVKIGNLLFLSGMLPVVGRKPQYVGRLGGALSKEDGRKAAEIACLNALSAAKAHLGSLDKITGVAKLGVYIATEGDFQDHPKVADGASELLLKVFGAEMLSGRVVLGVASLPLGMPIEIELVFEIAA
jgi:NAD(P)-dependent dehydrogenase (short-subunit alcohol dehydrogenase family)